MTRFGKNAWVLFRFNAAGCRTCWIKEPEKFVGFVLRNTRLRNGLIGLAAGVVLLCIAGESAPASFFTVVWVDDGDTIVLADGRRIRYIGIDTPEIAHEEKSGEPYADEARQYNASLVHNKKVHMEFDAQKMDHYGRVLAYIFLPDGSFVNELLLKSGCAYCLNNPPNIRCHKRFLEAQRTAITKNLGIWKTMDRQDETTYVGNKKSKRFHLETCPFGKRIEPRNKILFKGKPAAFWEGFAPCSRCISKDSSS
jgi:endonuclease YncB( thermonuclease family)